MSYGKIYKCRINGIVLPNVSGDNSTDLAIMPGDISNTTVSRGNPVGETQ